MSISKDKQKILQQRTYHSIRLPAFPVPDVWHGTIEQQVPALFQGMSKLEYVATQLRTPSNSWSEERAVRKAYDLLYAVEGFLYDLAEEEAERRAEAEEAKAAP